MWPFDIFKDDDKADKVQLPITVYCPHCNKPMVVDENVKYSCSEPAHREVLKEDTYKDSIKGNQHTDIFNVRPNCPICLKENGYPEQNENERPYGLCTADYIKCSAKQLDIEDKETIGCGESFPYQLLDDSYVKYRIGIVGYTSSGKSVFTSRLREIISQFPKLKVLDQFPGKEFNKIRILRGELLPEKNPENKFHKQNDVYYLGFKIYPGTKKEQKVLLIIYDLGGEDFINNNPNMQGIIRNADAIFVTLDLKSETSFDTTKINLYKVRALIASNSEKKIKFAYIFTKADAELRQDLITLNNKELENQQKSGENAPEKLIWLGKEGEDPNFGEYNEDCSGFSDSTAIAKSLLNNDANILDSFANK